MKHWFKRLLFAWILMVMFVNASFAAAQEENDPLATLAGYLSALKSQDGAKLLPYLNGKSLALMKGKPSNPGRMQMEANTIESCGLPVSRIEKQRAVVLFTEGGKTCSPYFMEFQKGLWRLDLYTMSQVVRFDKTNQWRIDPAVENPYQFAFRKKKVVQ